MRDLLDQVEIWLKNGQSVALATVIKTWGSSPRPAGAGMAITETGEIAGSVSGGCVEGAVIDSAMQVLRTGQPERIHFGVGDDLAWEVGLSCGGEIDVYIRQFEHKNLEIWKRALSKTNSVYLALVLAGSGPYLGADLLLENSGSIFSDLSRKTRDQLTEIANKELAGGIHLIEAPEIQEAFFHKVQPVPELILVGGVHIAIPLASLAKTVGFEVTVIDPRRLFSTVDRFPDIKLLLTEWPEGAFQKISITESSAIVMLTHDPKIDDPALKIALNSSAFYVGALGSRKTHQKRIERLKDAGLSQSRLDQIHAPVGLDLGGKTPPEIALGIMAEILQVWYGRDM
ncbi:MAG TPA: XdhC family protein [Chloroflexi bacterium]|nr:XdhC family protein [Chloroflexota bacterium]